MSDPTINELIAASSLGGGAWCVNCNHPDLVHEPSGCFSLSAPDKNGEQRTCSCETFKAMTLEEWLKWKGAE